MTRARDVEEATVGLLPIGARRFVALVFAILGGSFVYSAWVLWREFPDHFDVLVATHSHRYFFFPVLGATALACLYVPAVVLTDLYWRRPRVLRAGRLRFFFGFVVLSGASVLIALSYVGLYSFSEPFNLGYRNDEWRRAIWELSPRALADNKAAGNVEVAGCRTLDGQVCIRRPILDSLVDLREQSLNRLTITEFARPCVTDDLVERPPGFWALRRCFPSGQNLNAADCCKVQIDMAKAAVALLTEDGNYSWAGRVENVVAGFKAFFVIVVIVVGLMLAVWRKKLQSLYRGLLDPIERGVIVASGLMLIWLLMDYGFQQTGDVLYGRMSLRFPFRASLAVGVSAVALILYFLDRSEYNGAQIITAIGSALAVANYETIGNTAARFLGSGAPWPHFALLVVVAVVALILVYGPWKLPLPPRRDPPPLT